MRGLLKAAGLLFLLTATHGLSADLENFDCHDMTAVACKNEFGRLFEQISVDSFNLNFKEAFTELIPITKEAISTNTEHPEIPILQAILELLESSQSKLANEPPKNLFKVGELFEDPYLARLRTSILREDYTKIIEKAYMYAAKGTVEAFNALYGQMLKTKPEILETYPELKRIHDDVKSYETADEDEQSQIFRRAIEDISNFFDLKLK